MSRTKGVLGPEGRLNVPKQRDKIRGGNIPKNPFHADITGFRKKNACQYGSQNMLANGSISYKC